MIEEVKETNKEANPSLLWDTIKCVIRGHTIKFASNGKRRINAEIKDIETKLQNLQDDMQKPNADFDTIIENVEVLKHDLKMILNEKTQGAIVRSRTKWYEEGEKNSNYFINLEKRIGCLHISYCTPWRYYSCHTDTPFRYSHYGNLYRKLGDGGCMWK